MDIYVDTANLDEIKQANDLGILDGVTTNPSLLAKEGADFHSHMAKICDIVNGPVSAEVTVTDTPGMVKQAQELIKIADNIVIKVPCTVNGLKACKALTDLGIRTNLTLCFQATQAMFVAKAGAFLVSPFLGRIDDISGDGIELIHQIRCIYDNYDFETKILAASLRHPKHVVDCALAGADVATIPFNVIKQLMNHPLTDIGLDKFMADWDQLQAAKS